MLNVVTLSALRAGWAPVADRRVFCLRKGKVPHIASGARLAGSYASPDLPPKLSTLDEALERVGVNGTDGIGVVFFPGCGIVGLDLDHCVTSDRKFNLSPIQREALTLFAPLSQRYVEVSMSGTGLHVFALGDAQTVKANGVAELFGDKNFVALTGNGRGVVA